MIDTRREISLGFSPDKVREGQHICYIYNDDAERRRVMGKYLEAGLLAGERVMYLVDAMTPDEMVDSLEELGVDVRSKLQDATFKDATSAYCPSGSFSVEEMLGTVQDFYQTALSEGYSGARGTGEMSWCLVEGHANPEHLMEYEVRLNEVLANYPYTACCQYDARRFDGETIMDMLSVHPVMIVRGQLVKNPFCIEPREFLKEYRQRRANHA